MKKNRLFYMILAGLFVLSEACSDEVKAYLEDIPDPGQYTSLYMPQAYYRPSNQTVYVKEGVQSYLVAAYLGGPQAADSDIHITFQIDEKLVEEFNARQGTDYSLLPRECWEFPQQETYIPAGNQQSLPLYINVSAMGYVSVPDSYLLPVTLAETNSEIPVLENYKTTYFLFTGSYLPGQVPSVKVYSFGQAVTKPLLCREKDLIRIDENDNLQLYQSDEDGIFQEPRQIGQGWNGIDVMFYMPDNRFIIRNPDQNLAQYIIDDQYNFLGQREIGWGWGGASQIVPFKNLAFLAVNGDALTKYPINQNGDFDFPNCSDIESQGWGDYKQILCYGNSILALEAGGNLWEIPLSDDYVTSARRQVGSGWIFEKLVVCGTDLLALDANGDLWRYEFDPRAFWPLKAEEENTETE
ncbi:hypothetical protein CE91St19_28160 [Odoribacter laneus]|jgi:hypothetical protein|nr:DUF1735 domain-containing protein [Odoribacter laneus]GKI23414.1 hypothetical protein CE91St19_28160 [Odoribacter laneus]GKI24309.1 hypothetical protein CE91St20_04460 [Odoribacter laneus]